MKITLDLDITPEELRRFVGLPNIEGLQEEMMKMAQQQLADSGQQVFSDMIAGAAQPMLAYQKWLEQMMNQSGTRTDKDKPKKSEK